ncbi:MAG: A/G-specific adenine glycosylase [Spirochaetae bacterium HGW-Spirochaetae-10]|nr:MAG: A/G-specific adenine glycosylase [Spirochaetae bacterium HGW-Spirochaetae-10]
MERAASLLKGQAFGASLVDWYRENERDLPFRRSRDAYRIWISEIMLQQTRVAAMLPSYDRFIRRFPHLKSLALADLEEVLQHWKGLGYYQRARNLHRAAGQMHSEGLKTAPIDYDRLRTYAGIGPYTAAAIASIAGDQMHAVLDGNVKRVISRLLDRMESDRKLQQIADDLLKKSQQRPSLFNQAMMELGATVCIPGRPLCDRCPVRRDCQAGARGADYAATIPVSRKEAPIPLHVRVYVHRRSGDAGREYALIENSNGLFLKEQLSFPYSATEDERPVYQSPGLTEGEGASGQRLLGSFRHSIMKWRMRCDVILSETAVPGAMWLTDDEIEKRLHSSFASKVLSVLAKVSAVKVLDPVGEAADRADDDPTSDESRRVKKPRDLKAKKKELNEKKQHHQTKRKGDPDTVDDSRVRKKRNDLPENGRKTERDR